MNYPELKAFVGGSWVEPAGDRLAVTDPATEGVLGELPVCDPGLLAKAAEAAALAATDWRQRTPLARSNILRTAATNMRRDQERLAWTLSSEQGKTLAEARLELNAAADMFDWCAEEGRRIYGRVVPGRLPGLRQQVLRQPVGPALALTPWNFPAFTPARKIAAALGSGCTCIIKPSEETPATVVLMAQALEEAGLPPGVLNVVFGDPAAISRQLIADPRIRKISFTGSTSVGRELAAWAGQNMKRITLELGGHAPVLVFPDCDVAAVAAACVGMKYRNAGQVCISPSRFIVHEDVYEEFVDAASALAARITVGKGTDPATQMGPLANARRLDAVQRLVTDAQREGAVIRTGGERKGSSGHFFAPTVLCDVPASAAVSKEEPFGPLLCVRSFRSTEEALRIANELPYGLASYVFTDSARIQALVAAELRAGMVGINHFGISQVEVPFGGVHDSGYGSEGGTEGMDAYLDTKLVSAV